MPQNDQLTVLRIVSVVPAAASVVKKVSLPSGAYRIQVNVNSSVTGTTTALSFALYMDAAQTVASGVLYSAPSDNVAPQGFFSIAAGPQGKTSRLMAAGGGTGVIQQDPILIVPHGMQVTITKGTAVTDEKLEVDLVVARVDSHSVNAQVA